MISVNTRTRRLALSSCLLLSGCGRAASSDRFTPIDRAEVATAFQDPTTTTTQTTLPKPPSTTTTTTVAPTTTTTTTLPPTTVPSEEVVVYFVTADGRLQPQPIRRPIPVDPLAALNEMQSTRGQAGLRTFISPGLILKLTAERLDSAAYVGVHLDPSFLDRSPLERLAATAQITMTLTGLRGIGNIGLVVDNELIESLVPGLTLGSAPLVSHADYSALVITG